MAKINVAEVEIAKGVPIATIEVGPRGIRKLVANSRFVQLELRRSDFAMDIDVGYVLGLVLGFKDRFVGIEKKRMGVTASVYWMGRGDVSITTDDGVKVVVKWREEEAEEEEALVASQ